MMKKFLSKTLVLLLAFLMVFSCLGTAVFATDDDAEAEGVLNAETAEQESTEEKSDELEEIRELLNSNDYAEYELLYGNAANGEDDVTITGADFNAEKTTATVYTDNWAGSEEKVVLIGETGDVTWDFEIKKTGRYHIAITYAPVDAYDGNKDGDIEDAEDLRSRSATIKRALLLDDVYPFKQSRYIEMSRVWADAYVEVKANEDIRDGSTIGFEMDNDGNEIKPKKEEKPEWRTIMANDSTGYIVEPFLYYIEEGVHTISLSEVQETCAIKEIRIYYDEMQVSYEDYLKEHKDSADKAAGAKPVVIEAELAHRTSSNIIYPIYDRSSAVTQPQSAYNIYLNAIGGEKWQTAGSWISWELDIPADGFYTISPRFLQSFAEGMYVTREIKIDGKVPFTEASSLQFKYSDNWQLSPLSDGEMDKETGEERELKFYMTKGKHEIEMNVVLGDMADILNKVEIALNNINNHYLQILMLTGSEPDEYRDYQFNRLMPDVLKGLIAEAKVLEEISAQLEKINGTKGSDSVTLDNVAMLLTRMGEDEDMVAPNFSELKDYIGSLGSWIMTARNQPLELDYIVVAPAADVEAAGHKSYMKDNKFSADANFFQSIGYELKQFIMSWISDYSSYGVRTSAESEDYASIEVWTSSGRDQSTIMRSLISDSFTSQYNIAVDLKLVAAGSVLPATLSGSGPDINMTQASSTVINYAIRSAVLPVNPEGYAEEEGDSEEEKAFKKECREIFADYDEVVKQFEEAAMTPLELYGISYGLPETENFSMLFYRSDILLQLGLEIPQTWDDVYNMLPTLQTNNLEFGYQESLAGLLIMLYQIGEPLYRGNDETKTQGIAVNLDSNEALETFKEMCELYTMYGFPYSYNFANRFRTGEMPVGVQDYSTYSQLTIFAPELRGLWGFTKIPGTLRVNENGESYIDHTANTTVTGIVMMRDCEEIKAAWEFMKWWVSTETQSSYGQEYYALLGASGQYATANKESLFAMSWTADERKALMEQFDYLRATPEVPGGYIVTRYVEFAFLAAYNDDADPVESMLEYIDAINSELSRKRGEFGLKTFEDYEKDVDKLPEKQYFVPDVGLSQNNAVTDDETASQEEATTEEVPADEEVKQETSTAE